MKGKGKVNETINGNEAKAPRASDEEFTLTLVRVLALHTKVGQTNIPIGKVTVRAIARKEKVDHTTRQDKIKDTTNQTIGRNTTRQTQIRIKDARTFLAIDQINEDFKEILLINNQHKRMTGIKAGNRKICPIGITMYNKLPNPK